MLERHLLADIRDRDAQTAPITDPTRLPLRRDGTKYDHARQVVRNYHLDSPTLAYGDRHVLLVALREATAARERKSRLHHWWRRLWGRRPLIVKIRRDVTPSGVGGSDG